MRSAWSPTRSMSLDTLFDVWPSCLLALPTLLATDLTSTSIDRGSGTPSTFLRRVRSSDQAARDSRRGGPDGDRWPGGLAGHPGGFPGSVLTVPTTPSL